MITEIIRQKETEYITAERALSEAIHSTYRPDTEVEYQVGYSLHASSWEKYVVVGPYDKFKVIIRRVKVHRDDAVYTPDVTLDGRSYRLRLPEKGESVS